MSTYVKRHMTFREEDESLVCSDKALTFFFQTCISTFKNKYKF
jgi:hypothetical protein